MGNSRVELKAIRQRRRRRTLHVETLEPRVLLAGDTYLINFQFDEATAPTHYLRDVGAVFGDRGGGLSYGWSSDHTDQSRQRNIDPDLRLDTLIHFEVGQNWEFQLPNGLYEVTVAVGDPANNDGVHTINVEGVNYWNAVPDANDAMTMTQQVTVSDGRLTVDQGAAADKATRINYIHIVGLANESNAAPGAPTITEPSMPGQVVNPADVHMEAIGFSDPDGDAHKSTDWEIWTVGPGAEPVWQTLGIEGVERLHTHLGDGVFMNAQAGQTTLAANTDYELRVRFRDDAGSVSDYATRTFHTGAASTTFPMQIEDVVASPAPSWESVLGGALELPSGTAIFAPGDPIIAIDLDGGSDYPGNESPSLAIDGNAGTKYLNFGEIDSGFIITPSRGSSIVSSFQITTANDFEERDPVGWQLFGTNSAIVSTDNSTGMGESWTLIDSGLINLPSARNTAGPVVSVDNDTEYASYRMVFTSVKNAGAANSMQIAEIQFFGADAGAPHSMRLESGSTGEELLTIEATDSPGNVVNHFPALTGHHNVRVVIEAGSTNLVLPQSNFTFTDELGIEQTIYLPSVSLTAGQRLDLWVSNSGATYFGTPGQTDPDFSLLARQANLNIPFIATQPGFVVELVGSDYRLPVNIAFVPDPGPNPDDPLYYVTELYGSIQVVTRDGTKHTFATGLLDYNPTGPISGSGEQGMTGIAVQRDAENPEIYHLFVGMLWDNGSPAGGASHYPKVERIDSVAGGLSMDSRTVLLNMQPETQGQSHQISNISIGPDGKLYVHNGDGFDAGTAQDLDQFRGKILRMNLDGTAPIDNPFYNAADGINARDYVFAYGFRNPFAGAWRASDGKHYEAENGPSVDRLAQVNEGVNYGWDGNDASMFTNAIYNWTSAHAPVNMTFVQPETFGGSMFPSGKMDHLFISESGSTYATGPQSNGKRIVEFVLDANGEHVGGPTTLVEYVGTGQSTIVGLAAGPDGLYFTELYEDSGANGPTAVGARIYRVRYINSLPGDYDIDGDVDQDDYDVWVENFGSNLHLAADGNGDGIVDTADYTIWRDNLGAGSAAAASPLASESVGEASTTGQSAGAAAEPSSSVWLDVSRKPDRNVRFRPQLRAAAGSDALPSNRSLLLLATAATIDDAEPISTLPRRHARPSNEHVNDLAMDELFGLPGLDFDRLN